MRIHSRYFLKDIRDKYNITNIIAPDGFVYCKVKRGLYGLKQAAKLARDQLIFHMKKYGYSPAPFAPNIWTHTTRRTKFCLCVDDFAVKYYSNDDAEHLISSLKHAYAITVDYSGKKFCGLDITWDYKRRFVEVSMPQYVLRTLEKLQHPYPSKPQHAPHQWIAKKYGVHSQETPPEDTSPPLPPEGKTHIQRVTGSFLFYGRVVDNTILSAVNKIVMSQATPTITTIAKTKMLMDYLATHPTAKIRYYASGMQLYIESDAAYLVCPGAKSRVAGYFHMGRIAVPLNPSTTISSVNF